jgi:hypothetical protein
LGIIVIGVVIHPYFIAQSHHAYPHQTPALKIVETLKPLIRLLNCARAQSRVMWRGGPEALRAIQLAKRRRRIAARSSASVELARGAGARLAALAVERLDAIA